MKPIAVLTVLAVWLAVANVGIAADDPLVKILPEVEIKQLDPQEAIATIIETFNKLYPDDEKVRGYVFCTAATRRNRISLSLKNVPLDVALTAVANSIGARFHCADKAILIVDEQSLEETLFAAKLTDEVLNNLGLKRPLSAEGFEKAVRSVKIELDEANVTQFDSKQEYVRLRMRVDEANKLRALFDLFNRGLRLTQSTEKPTQ